MESRSARRFARLGAYSFAPPWVRPAVDRLRRRVMDRWLNMLGRGILGRRASRLG